MLPDWLVVAFSSVYGINGNGWIMGRIVYGMESMGVTNGSLFVDMAWLGLQYISV